MKRKNERESDLSLSHGVTDLVDLSNNELQPGAILFPSFATFDVFTPSSHHKITVPDPVF